MSSEGVRVLAGTVTLDGNYAAPRQPSGVVLFAHGSGSSRHSPRNQYVAGALNRAGFATLLMDLLTAEENDRDAATGELRFDIPLLARRLGAGADWLASFESAAALPLFLFGASTGAAAALSCSAERPGRVHGVISRGGRPDLAGVSLQRTKAPTLLIVGGNDHTVLGLNRQAAQAIAGSGGSVELVIVPNATHLFEEPGALDLVIDATVDRLHRWRRAVIDRDAET